MNYLLIISLFFISLDSLAQSGCGIISDSSESRIVYNISDEPPKFSSHTDSLERYIQSKLTFPQECIEGAVYIGFVVEASGQVTNARVVKGIKTDIDNQALSLVSNMSNWIPGKCDGNPISHFMVIPIRFSLTTKE
ncbi:TonB family protein [Marivirga sp. S37H4]|uniref:TonB family protein n=1 Tax=Marivirga aurantiaca TaxID=2802615 RepID=A0A935C7I5_9BACT|nr:TonB family protein [Marivirga aurantiaca]MBK6264387.1 TonB family protein [Marivirga aurantiaca]